MRECKTTGDAGGGCCDSAGDAGGYWDTAGETGARIWDTAGDAAGWGQVTWASGAVDAGATGGIVIGGGLGIAPDASLEGWLIALVAELMSLPAVMLLSILAFKSACWLLLVPDHARETTLQLESATTEWDGAVATPMPSSDIAFWMGEDAAS